jgi:hypothetical protein
MPTKIMQAVFGLAEPFGQYFKRAELQIDQVKMNKTALSYYFLGTSTT